MGLDFFGGGLILDKYIFLCLLYFIYYHHKPFLCASCNISCQWDLLQVKICHFNMTTLVFDSFPAFWNKISQANLEHTLFQFCNQPFFQGSLISFSRQWYFRVLIASRLSLFQILSKDQAGKLVQSFIWTNSWM